MRSLKKVGLATVMILPLAGTAFAADAIQAPPEPPVEPIVQPEPVQLWTGPYAGVFLGYNWGNFDTIPDDGADDIAGGAYAGYNWQLNNNVVVGVEGDLGYSAQEGESAARDAELGIFGSARARVGYAFNPFMVYATGGVAAGEVEYSNGLGSDSNTQVGYTVGGGVEGLVTDNITARLEYRYTDLGEDDYSLPGESFSSGYDEHSVRAGVGFKF